MAKTFGYLYKIFKAIFFLKLYLKCNGVVKWNWQTKLKFRPYLLG